MDWAACVSANWHDDNIGGRLNTNELHFACPSSAKRTHFQVGKHALAKGHLGPNVVWHDFILGGQNSEEPPRPDRPDAQRWCAVVCRESTSNRIARRNDGRVCLAAGRR